MIKMQMFGYYVFLIIKKICKRFVSTGIKTFTAYFHLNQSKNCQNEKFEKIAKMNSSEKSRKNYVINSSILNSPI